MATYTKVPKPTGTVSFKQGMTMGLIIPLTNAKDRTAGNPYVKIGKPTGANYTSAPSAKVMFDASIPFDDPNTFFDGTNPSSYTKISKPT